MPRCQAVNNALTTLAAAYTDGVSTSLTVQAGKGALFGTPTAGSPLRITAIRASAIGGSGQITDLTKYTIFRCTSRTGDVLSGLTFEDGTAQDFAVNDVLGALAGAGEINDLNDDLAAAEAAVALKATDSLVVHLAGAETITGTKVFSVPVAITSDTSAGFSNDNAHLRLSHSGDINRCVLMGWDEPNDSGRLFSGYVGGTLRPMIVQGSTVTLESSLEFQALASGSMWPQGQVVPGWADPSGPTRKGQVSLYVSDFTGTDKEALRAVSLGVTGSYVSIMGATPFRFDSATVPDFGGFWVGTAAAEPTSSNFALLAGTTNAVTALNAPQGGSCQLRTGGVWTLIVTDFGSIGVPRVIVDYIPTATAGDAIASMSVNAFNNTYRALSLQGKAAQASPLLVLRGLSSTSAVRDMAFIDAVWSVSTETSQTGDLVFSSCGFNGTHEGMRFRDTGGISQPIIPIANVRDAADDAAAAALTPAVPQGGLYRTGSILKIRVS